MSESDVPTTTATEDRITLVTGAEPPGIADISETDHTVVAAFGDAERWLDAVYGPGDGGPDALVCAGEVIRSATASPQGADVGPGRVTVTAVPEVGSLGQMAAEIREAVLDGGTGGESVGVLVTGFDAAIDATSLEASFRFLHVLRAFLTATTVEAPLYVYTSEPLSDVELETLRPLFSTVESRGD